MFSRRSIHDVLPDNVMFDVITRLPVKTIICCKCVCKRWRDIVSDPYFVDLHLLRSRDYALMMNETSYFPGLLRWVEMTHETDYNLFTVKSLYLNRHVVECGRIVQVGSVNGLICFAQLYGGCVYVFNPVFEEYITTLPPPRGEGFVTSFGYGFGVSMADGEYKVIRLSCRRAYTVVIEVYTLGTDDRWRSLGQTPFHLNLRGELGPGVYLNSHVYWQLEDGKISDFDLIMETFELYPSTPPAQRDTKNRMLGVLKGRLSCICWGLSGGVEVWVIKEGSNWYREIAIHENISPLGKLDNLWTPLCLIDGGLNDTTILLVYLQELLHTVVPYCLNTNRILDLNSLAFLWITTYGNECLIYRPSFVKIKDKKELRACCTVKKKDVAAAARGSRIISQV